MLTRILLYTHIPDRLAEFYARHFGYTVLRSETDRLIELAPPGPGAAILLHPASARQKPGQSLVKLVFEVRDVAAFCAEARKNGLDFGPIHQSDGYTFANARDPAKNPIQVSSRAFAGA